MCLASGYESGEIKTNEIWSLIIGEINPENRCPVFTVKLEMCGFSLAPSILGLSSYPFNLDILELAETTLFSGSPKRKTFKTISLKF